MMYLIFTTRRYASVVYAVIMSVCLSVCLSKAVFYEDS